MDQSETLDRTQEAEKGRDVLDSTVRGGEQPPVAYLRIPAQQNMEQTDIAIYAGTYSTVTSVSMNMSAILLVRRYV